MTPSYLLPVGEVEEDLVGAAETAIVETYEIAVVRLPPLPDPRHAYDPERRQYGSIPVLQDLLARVPADGLRLLGITACDLFIPMLSFVYGQAQLQGRVALVSVARLRQEFYGLPPDPRIARERTARETLHELGHTFGLTHCLDPGCPMALSTTIQQLDRKGLSYCRSCTIVMRDALARERPEVRP